MTLIDTIVVLKGKVNYGLLETVKIESQEKEGKKGIIKAAS